MAGLHGHHMKEVTVVVVVAVGFLWSPITES